MMIMVIIVVWGLGPVGLGWVSYLVGWVGYRSIKWTHGQLWLDCGVYRVNITRCLL